MTTRKIRMDDLELSRRAQEPGDKADERRRDAKQFLKALEARDNEVSERIAKLKALRLGAEQAARDASPPPVAGAAPKPTKRAAKPRAKA
jgi:hypothetical protein